MAEIPVSHSPRTKGQSKYGLSQNIQSLFTRPFIHPLFFKIRGVRGQAISLGVWAVSSQALVLRLLAYLADLKMLGESIGNRPLMFLGFFAVAQWCPTF
jgi:glutamine amidotransferase-like uncharacterized protein